MLAQVAVVLRQGEDDAIRDLEAGFFAYALNLTDEVEDTTLEPKLVVQSRVDCDDVLVLVLNGPALAGGVVERELAPVQHERARAQRPVRDLEASLVEESAQLGQIRPVALSDEIELCLRAKLGHLPGVVGDGHL